MLQYANVPRTIALLISARMATLNELQTCYGIQDAYDMLEILSIDSYNTRKAMENG